MKLKSNGFKGSVDIVEVVSKFLKDEILRHFLAMETASTNEHYDTYLAEIYTFTFPQLLGCCVCHQG